MYSYGVRVWPSFPYTKEFLIVSFLAPAKRGVENNRDVFTASN